MTTETRHPRDRAGDATQDHEPDDRLEDDLDDGLEDDRGYAPPAMPVLPWLLLVGGAIGWVAAFTLTYEKFKLLVDPSYVPSCSINPVLSCGSIMGTDQAEVFGFPNPIMGVAGFAVVVAVGAGLLAGARFAPWFWAGLQAGVVLGVVFVHWLIWQSLYEIGALCPYCMVVWTVTIPLFVYVTRRNLAHLAPRLPAGPRRVAATLVDYHALVLLLWAVAVLSLITIRFWDFWSLGPSAWF